MGRLSPSPEMRRRAVPLRKILRPGARPVPDTDDYAAQSQGALTQMMNNDREGCCSETAFAKWFGMIASYRPGGKTLVATAAEVSKFYHEVTGPGDNGTYMIDMFEYAMRTGFQIGGTRHKIAGYAVIDVRDTELLNAAMHWFEGVQLGVNLTQKQYSNFSTGSLWTYDGSRIVGGHSVPLTMRGPDKFRLATWAQQPDVSRACVQNPNWAEEAYVCISQDMVDAEGHGANNIDWATFTKAMDQIRAGEVPDIGDDPTPPVPPVPTGPGTFAGNGSLDFLGTMMPLTVAGTITQSIAPATMSTVNVWAVLADLAAIYAATRAKDWTAVAKAVAQLIADLGLSMTDDEQATFARTLVAHYATQVILNPCPPNG